MTKTLLSMALCLVLIVASSLHSVRSQQLARVGVILDFSNVQGKQSNVSLHLALEDINQNFLDSSYRLQLIVDDSSAYKTMLSALDIFKEEVIAIIVQDDVISGILSPIAIALDVPLLSLSDHGNSSRDSATSVVMPSASEDQMECIAALFSNFLWKEAAVIVEDGQVWLKGVVTLEDTFWKRALRSDSLFGHKSRVSLTHLVSTNDSIAYALDAVKRGYVRVIVVHASAEIGLQVLREANDLGMLGEGYAWVVSEPLASSLESLDDASLNILQGVLGVRRFIRMTQRLRNLFQRIRSSVRPLDKLNCLRSYNSLWMLAQAFQSILDEGDIGTAFVEAASSSISIKKWSAGRTLAENLQALNSTTFINPLQENDREMQIVNVVELRVKGIGFWDRRVNTVYYSRGGNASAGKNLGAIVWPGDTSNVPTGFTTIEVGLVPNMVFKQFVERDNTSKTNFSGFSISMFEEVIKQLPYVLSFRYKAFDVADTHSSSYDLLIKSLATQGFYAGVGDVTILAERWKHVTFTQPYTKSGLVMMVNRKTKETPGVSFVNPFSKPLWAIIVLFFFITAGILWFSEHRHNNRSVETVTGQLITSVSFSFAALTTFHGEKVMSSLARGVLVVWLLTAVIITNTYTARLSSILTSKTMVPDIKKIEDLTSLTTKPNIRVGFMNGSFVKSFLTDNLRIHKTHLLTLQTPEDYASALQHSHVEAIVDEIPFIDFVNSRYYNCNDIAVVQNGYYSAGGFGFFFPKGSPFVSDISTAVLKVSEDQYTVDAITEEWLGKTDNCFYQNSVTEASSGSIHLQSLRYLFVCTALLYAICAAIFIANNRFRKQKSEPITTPERKEDHVSLLMPPPNEEGSSRIQIKQDEPESSSTSRSGRQKCLEGEGDVEDGDELGPSPSICSSVSRGESVRTVEEPWVGMEEAIGAPDVEYLSKIKGPSHKGKDKRL